MDQQRSVVKIKIKKIDDQIALLNSIKNQGLAKLQSLSQITVQHPNPVVNNQTAAIKLYCLKVVSAAAMMFIPSYGSTIKPASVGIVYLQTRWDSAICRKPIIKCSECPNQGFLPPDEVAIRQHLTGAQVMGIYPMVKNESCYFLAMDFDKENWLEDVGAIAETCHEEGVPAAVKRSRSGRGGHVWIFFSEEVPAFLARGLGSILITKTMAKRYQMDMKSYDRFFPARTLFLKEVSGT